MNKRTVKLLRKFSDIAGPMTNCLEDIACPKCAGRENLHIEATMMVELHDGGTDGWGDTEWTGKSYICCNDCDHGAKVRQFTFPGLDAALATRRRKETDANIEAMQFQATEKPKPNET